MLGIALFLILPTSTGAVNLTVHVDTSKSTHVVDPLFMGVHTCTSLLSSLCSRGPPACHPLVSACAVCPCRLSLG